MMNAADLRTPEGVLAYQRMLLRTKNYLPVGRIESISIGPSKYWDPAKFSRDPFIRKFGRFVHLRGRMVPLAISRDGGMALICSVFVLPGGRVGFPDVPDPDWKAEPWTEDEVTRKVIRPIEKDQAPMIPQRMTDRCEYTDDKPAVIPGTNLLIFQPLVRIAYQLEHEGQLMAAGMRMDFRPDTSRVPAVYAALLVDHKTGDAFIYGGIPEISSARDTISRSEKEWPGPGVPLRPGAMV
jgi:hypothetical protein